MKNELTPQAIEQYRRDGFLVIEDFSSAGFIPLIYSKNQINTDI